MTIKLHSLGHKDPHGVSKKSCQVTIAHVLHLRVPWPETSLSSKLQLCAVYFLLPTRLQETLISSSSEIPFLAESIHLGSPWHTLEEAARNARGKRYLVIAGNSDIHVAQWGVSVAQGNGGDVDVGGLCQRLVISPGVRNHQEPRLTESCLDLVCEGARGETPGNGSSSSGSRKLQNRTLQKRTRAKVKQEKCISTEPEVHFSQVTQTLPVNVHEI